MLRLTPGQWRRFREHLAQHYPPSVMLIRACMRRELGFTPRDHLEYREGDPVRYVCLDFYDDRMQSWFVLKYSEWL